ncbi:MAG: SPOR domain-containing protein [Thermodesulfovibrionales bacterium]
MSDSGLNQTAHGALAGKGPVIIVTVFFSLLTFVLGYFVGKAGDVSAPDTVRQVSDAVESQQPVQAAPPTSLPAPASPPIEPAAESSRPPVPAPVAQPAAPAPEPRTPGKESVRVSAPEARPAPAVRTTEESSYTVQVGAFRNKAEAERFRAKYSKKGYKIYIRPVKENKNMTIYKLRAGEFRDKKDAEVLALKLKKTEDLKTFVTPSSE